MPFESKKARGKRARKADNSLLLKSKTGLSPMDAALDGLEKREMSLADNVPGPASPARRHQAPRGEDIAVFIEETHRMQQILAGIEHPEGKSTTDLSDKRIKVLLGITNGLSRSLRDAYVYKAESFPEYIEREKDISEIDNIVITEQPNTLFAINIFPLLPIKNKSAYNVYSAVINALEAYLQEHYDTRPKPSRLLLLYERHSKSGEAGCWRNICDNDNWEMKRVTNAICEALLFSDRACNVSMMYHTIFDNAEYVKVYCIPLEKSANFLADYPFENGL